jgi:hypothetical protein
MQQQLKSRSPVQQVDQSMAALLAALRTMANSTDSVVIGHNLSELVARHSALQCSTLPASLELDCVGTWALDVRCGRI